ncbi:MAG: carboxymuconolactone decarboxylase family protein [Bacteroidetes bacterium]|nr:MAG: carboxymuconolactone decarboxylase family protein [Bacteroidota bacterium]
MTVDSTDQLDLTAKKKFQRRYYQSWSNFWRDLKYLLSNRAQIKIAISSPQLNPAFRERLMLAVTEVNLCRYCRTFHVGQAKQAGIPIEEITVYLKGTIPDEVPDEQKLAVCYARHWAETNSQPDLDYINQVKETYGEDGFQAINLVLRMITMGNLLGNTWDYLLFKISFGRWGQ